jgi:hypothetical protein
MGRKFIENLSFEQIFWLPIEGTSVLPSSLLWLSPPMGAQDSFLPGAIQFD